VWSHRAHAASADAFYLRLDGTRLTVDELLGQSSDDTTDDTTDDGSDGDTTDDGSDSST